MQKLVLSSISLFQREIVFLVNEIRNKRTDYTRRDHLPISYDYLINYYYTCVQFQCSSSLIVLVTLKIIIFVKSEQTDQVLLYASFIYRYKILIYLVNLPSFGSFLSTYSIFRAFRIWHELSFSTEQNLNPSFTLSSD